MYLFQINGILLNSYEKSYENVSTKILISNIYNIYMKIIIYKFGFAVIGINYI